MLGERGTKMNCLKCFQEIPDGSKFCPHCGAEQTVVEPVVEPAAEEKAEVSQEPEVTEEVVVEPVSSVEEPAEEKPVYTSADSEPYNGSGTQQNENAQESQQYQQNNYGQNNYGQNNYQQGGCQQGGYQQNGFQQPQYQQVNWVPYLVLSIICTVCCCLPFGIVGIVYAVKVNSSNAAGDYLAAQKAAKTAKIWIIASAVCGLIANIFMFFVYGIGMSGYYYY